MREAPPKPPAGSPALTPIKDTITPYMDIYIYIHICAPIIIILNVSLAVSVEHKAIQIALSQFCFPSREPRIVADMYP